MSELAPLRHGNSLFQCVRLGQIVLETDRREQQRGRAPPTAEAAAGGLMGAYITQETRV